MAQETERLANTSREAGLTWDFVPVHITGVGARAVELKVSKAALAKGSLPDVFRSYYNGGGVFVDAPKYRDQGVEILASYTEELKVDSGEGTAAVVYCKVGEGAAVLTCPHPEFVVFVLQHGYR